MDSGSGSLQSTSGGEEEYDSRAAADSVSAFIRTGSTITHAPPQQQAAQPFFDPFSSYFQLPQNPNPAPSRPWPTFTPSFQLPSAAAGSENHHPPPQPHSPNHAAARNPKKRSRASRRAPTTVLTTDTSNFRAMVQEFTGIPAPPFTTSPFPRTRLDLFGTRSTSAAQPPPPQYLRRPFPQKPQPTPLPFLASPFNSGSGGIALDGAAMAAASSPTANNNITSVSSSPALNNQTSNLFTISNPLLTSFLQTNPKFQNPPLMGSSKTQNTFEIPPNAHQSQSKFMGFDEQFGLSHDNHVPDQNVAVLRNLIPSDQNNNNPVHGDTDINLSSINGGGYNFERNSTNFHGDKGPENASAVVGRGEGMVESWICSSE